MIYAFRAVSKIKPNMVINFGFKVGEQYFKREACPYCKQKDESVKYEILGRKRGFSHKEWAKHLFGESRLCSHMFCKSCMLALRENRDKFIFMYQHGLL